VVWIGWGFDDMRLPSTRLGPLPLPGTARLVQGARSRSESRGRHPLVAKWRAWGRRAEALLLPAKPPALVAAAARIDVFSANPADAGPLREALPSLRAVFHPIPSFTVEDVFAAGPAAMAGRDVQLGNSATPANNHVEAIELLRTRLPEAGRLLVPLSYGRASYARAVIEVGRAALAERFDPLTDWMPIAAYNQRMASCGFVCMNHRRQQALGNICAALYRGATVYLQRENPLFGFLVGLGVTLRDIESLDADAQAPLQALDSEQRLRNRAAIEARYGRAQVVAAIRALRTLGR